MPGEEVAPGQAGPGAGGTLRFPGLGPALAEGLVAGWPGPEAGQGARGSLLIPGWSGRMRVSGCPGSRARAPGLGGRLRIITA